MKTIYYTASSLDGYIADQENSLDWLFQFGDPEDSSYPEFIKSIGAVAMGSTTYEWVLPHLPKDAGGRTQWVYEQPTWVFSTRSLPKLETGEIYFVEGDVKPIYEEMAAAAKGKDLWIAGGGDLVGQFYDQGLLDEIIVTIASVTLAKGAPFLPREITTPPLRLLSAKTTGPDFVELRYAVQR